MAVVATSLHAEVVISEFLASNDTTLKDDFREDSDWIELYNNGTEPLNLLGWRLTDSAGNLSKWVFPERTLPPGGFLVVFASGRDRKLPDAPLHTNFSLSADGEFLALVRPDGSIASSYAPSFPRQTTDISYGIPQSEAVVAIPAGAEAQIGVPGSEEDFDEHFENWREAEELSNSSWQTAQTGVGYAADASYGGLISETGNLADALADEQRTVCLRIGFQIDHPGEVAFLRLRMKFADGFVAWINGHRVASALAPDTLEWNSAATAERDASLNEEWEEFLIPASAAELRAGANLLAIQGLKASADRTEFLLLPELEVVFAATGEPGYFTVPTPGEINGSATVIGPLLTNPTRWISRPMPSGDSADEIVSVRVHKTIHDIEPGSVRLFHRTMFDAEVEVEMRDDGVAPDATPNDGVYTAALPTRGLGPGEMLRWRFEASDVDGNIGRAPAFLHPDDNDQYFGTVAWNPSESPSSLPIVHLFMQTPGAAATLAGTRTAVFYLGAFYDNVAINLHGQSTAGFPKSSRNLDFNRDNRFLWSGTAPRKVKDINLLSNYADKTRTRNTLAHEVHRMALGIPHFAFPVRVQLNSQFHSVMDMVEDGDDRMLERNGLDPYGALYKIYDHLASTETAKKRTRKNEDASDLQALIDGLDPSRPLEERRLFAYDAVNIPATINYLAARLLISDVDHGHKNYYVYHDTFRTGEWRPIVWDVDLSFGHVFTWPAAYLDDRIYTQEGLFTFAFDETAPNYNRLYRLIAEVPEFRAMFLRRVRTLMDTILQPPGTTDGPLETRMRQIVATIDPNPAGPNPNWPTDGDLDFDKWGTWGRGLRPREETEYVIDHYFEPRRAFLYNQNPATRPRFGTAPGSGDPVPDNAQSNVPEIVVIDAVEPAAESGNDEEEYLVLRNTTSEAVDISGWRLEGAISHTFEGGTVIPPGDSSAESGYAGVLHVVRNALAFRARATSPTGGEGRLVQGNYSGSLGMIGGEIHLYDDSGQWISSFTYAGEPSVRESFRIVEIQYHPADPTSAELAAAPGTSKNDYEYLAFQNIGYAPLDLTGVRFTAGITYVFPAVTLAPGGRLVLAKNLAAFHARYPSVDAVVVGPYDGQLDNAGERLALVDANGSIVFDFSYNDGWYPVTDGGGPSLVLRNPHGNVDLSASTSWAISSSTGGNSGGPEPAPAITYQGWDNFHFTSSERDNPSISGPAADPDLDGRSNWLEYAQGTDPRVHDTPRVEILWMDDDGESVPAIRFDRPRNALDVTYRIEFSTDLVSWTEASSTLIHTTDVSETVESVFHRIDAPLTSDSIFLRVIPH
jgi:Spore coat assembly protein